MICAYVDESGNSGTDLQDPNQPRHYVGALLIPEAHWSDINAAMRGLAAEAIALGAAAQGFEFHGSKMFAGNEGWRSMLRTDRMLVYEKCIDLLEIYNLHLVVGCCDKVKLREYEDAIHPHLIAFDLCLERIAKHAAEMNSLVFVVADDNESIRQQTRGLLHTRRREESLPSCQDMQRVVDTIHFMDSAESWHLQLCDLSLFALRRWEHSGCEKIGALGRRVNSRIWSREIHPR